MRREYFYCAYGQTITPRPTFYALHTPSLPLALTSDATPELSSFVRLEAMWNNWSGKTTAKKKKGKGMFLNGTEYKKLRIRKAAGCDILRMSLDTLIHSAAP